MPRTSEAHDELAALGYDISLVFDVGAGVGSVQLGAQRQVQ